MEDNSLSGKLLTLSELANYLKVAEKTILRMIQKNEIPCVKIASQWRFDKGLIDSWIMSKMKSSNTDELTKLMQKDADSVPLSRLTSEEFIILNISPGSIESVLKQLTMPLVKAKIVKNLDIFVNKLISRENMISTAVGDGIAMPHIRNPRENTSSRPVIVVGICPDGTDFNAVDKKKVSLFFLIYTNNEIAHLRIISKLSGFLRNSANVSQFLSAKTSEDVYKLLML